MTDSPDGPAMAPARKPKRIQRKRTAGWRMPERAVYVGRTSGYSLWANPFKVGGYFMIGDPDPHALLRTAWMQTFRDPPESCFTLITDRVMAVEWFRRLCEGWTPGMRKRCREELGGRDLVCWCPLADKDGNPVPCHADVLLEIANGAP